MQERRVVASSAAESKTERTVKPTFSQQLWSDVKLGGKENRKWFQIFSPGVFGVDSCEVEA